jgi:hypothetical protein
MEIKPLAAAIRKAFGDLRAICGDGGATEHSYRSPIEALLQAAAKQCAAAVKIRHEPKPISGAGAPDFIAYTASGAIGYVECKTPGANLDAAAKSEQIRRYRRLSDNLLLTDGLRWMHLRDDAVIADARVASSLSARPAKAEDAAGILRAFIIHSPEPVSDAGELARALAVRCLYLRDFLRKIIGEQTSPPPLARKLRGVWEDFRKNAFRGISEEVFIDALAQTLVYGMFLARLSARDGEKIRIDTIDRAIPPRLTLLRELAEILRLLGDDRYKGAHWIVGDTLEIVNQMDLAEIKKSLSFSPRGGDAGGDPYIYFYEKFLQAYSPDLREQRGVYYTPPPVVGFIVGAVESLLRNEFKLPRRFADAKKVTVLDFAAGTGTFMIEAMRRALAAADKGARNSLIRGHLLKNFYGFEYLIAPYAVAHLKVSQFLEGAAQYRLRDDECAQIYLTNTLAPASEQSEILYLPALADEVKNAQRVKDNPVLAIIGNPPYSGHSQTASTEKYTRAHKKDKTREITDTRDTWIGDLLRAYYKADGKPLREKNPKWLQDDYVKFIRFAQWKMESVERGIVAIITNHAFLDNPTFRGMRQSLMKTFNRLYFLDLHGNLKKKERAPNGGKDENVFDIRQGVAVSIMVKAPRLSRAVYRADLWGTRKHKYERCAALDLKTIKWKKLTPASPLYLFVPQRVRAVKKYGGFYSLADIFPAHSAGVVTARDKVLIGFSDGELRRSIKAHYRGKVGEEKMRTIAYRPFDERKIYYDRNFIARSRYEIMRHFLAGQNIGLIAAKRKAVVGEWNNVWITDKLGEGHFNLEINYVFPLYLYLENGELNGGGYARRENIAPEFRRALEDRAEFSPKPEDILGYVYAILHSPSYRKKYADFLRYDFPRIPPPPSAAAFRALAKRGGKLIDAHLLRKIPGRALTRFHGEGDDGVDAIRYADGKRLYINPNKYFAPLPPPVWEFQIGGYHPLKKYLHARKGRILSLDEITRVCDAANAIAYTLREMRAIDADADWL